MRKSFKYFLFGVFLIIGGFTLNSFFSEPAFACRACTSCSGCGKNYVACDDEDCSCHCRGPSGECFSWTCSAYCDTDAVGCPTGTVTTRCDPCAGGEEPPPPPEPSCHNCCHFDLPSEGATLVVGETYTLSGWAYFDDYCDSPGEMFRVDLHQCQPKGTTENCQPIGNATYGVSRPDTLGHCNNTTSETGWSYEWTVPETMLGEQTIWSIAINEADMHPQCWVGKTVMVVTPTPTPTPTPCLPPSPPTNLSYKCSQDGTSVTVSWSKADNATGYALRVDNKTDGWDDSCSSEAGDFCDDDIGGTSYTFPVSCDNSYDWWVHAFNECGYSPRQDGPSFSCLCPLIPGCTLKLLSEELTIAQGEEIDLIALLTPENASLDDVSGVGFSSFEDSIVITDWWDATHPFSTGIIGKAADEKVTINATGHLLSGQTCSDSLEISVSPPGAWFQTKGGDVSSQGEISSSIPESVLEPYFSLEQNGYPGVVSFNSEATPFFDGGSVSSKGWLARQPLVFPFSFEQFYKKLDQPEVNWNGTDDAPFVNPPEKGETRVIYSQGKATIEEIELSSGGKLIILVKGEVEIKGDIVVSPGSFLGIIANDDIKFDSSVGKAQGMFFSDGRILTGGGDKQFLGEGIFYAKAFGLSRSLGNRDSFEPAEIFTFRPDLVINAPYELYFSVISWQEVAP